MKLLHRERLLLWDYDRGTLAYDLIWVALLLLLLLGPEACLSDPMIVRW